MEKWSLNLYIIEMSWVVVLVCGLDSQTGLNELWS